MIKIAALTSGKNVPSTRFRIRQHIPYLAAEGAMVTEYCPIINKYKSVPGWPQKIGPKYILPVYGAWQGVKVLTRLPGLIGSYAADITWLERQLLPGYLTLEKLLKKPLVFDVDDAIWLGKPFGRTAVAKTAQHASMVIVGNSYLADWFSQYTDKIIIIPTAVDTENYVPKLRDSRQDKFTIGWIGTSGNLKYLQAIELALQSVIQAHPDTEILVVSDKPPIFKHIQANVCYMPWSEDTEISAIQAMDVGLMPLADDEWTKGKCSFKMLQYMACGIPVVVSPVGMNQQVLTKAEFGFAASSNAEWYDALCCLYINREQARQYGANGRAVVEQYYSTKVVSQSLLHVFQKLSGLHKIGQIKL